MTMPSKAQYQLGMEQIQVRFGQAGDVGPGLRARTALVDEIVVGAFSETLGAAAPEGVSLVAVGGYGRGELFPHSDVDLLVLVRRATEDPVRKEALSEFLRRLWDVGFRVSQSVRTPEECSTLIDGNLELTISLLDQRSLAGDPSLYGAFRERLGHFIVAERKEIIRRLCRLTRSRHARFHETIYRLEPDVKEGCGGLRDLQTVAWLRKLRDAGQDDSLNEPAGFLSTVRCFLHFRALRDANVLNFEAQDDIAEAGFSRWHDPAEWMRSYYRQSRAAWRAVLQELETSEGQDRSLLAQFRDWRSRLSNAEFTVSRDRIFLRNPHDLTADAGLALRAFSFMARHGIPLAAETEQRIAESLARLRGQVEERAARSGFWRELLSLPHAPAALRSAQDCGLLSALIPAWSHIEHLVVRDFYHQYTVDEHTFVSLDVLDGLHERKEEATKRFAELLEESAEQSWLLRLALLFHDTGKGQGGNHDRRSLDAARATLSRMGVLGQDAAMVEFLVENHLFLSSILQSRDLSDPATASQAAAKVLTAERLRLLTLMTFADVSAVNGSAMSTWRMEQLWRLYRITLRELTRGLSEDRIADEAVTSFAPESPEMAEFLEGLPSRYLWTHTAEEARRHFEMYRRAMADGVADEVARRDGAWHVAVLTDDRPFLFASLAGALASFGLNILRAEAFANRRGVIVDTFVAVDPAKNLELNPPEVERLRVTLARVARGQVRAEELLRYRPIKAAPGRRGVVEPLVTPDDEASASATVFEVVAQDRPGLLFSLASAISRAGCNIEVVLVDTEAHKAIDVFHITRMGKKLNPEERDTLASALLTACRSASESQNVATPGR